MDDIKGTHVSLLSRFLDSAVRTDPFGENQSGKRIYKRGERLAAALFLLTKHIPQDEPLRTEVRRSATALLAQLLSLRHTLRAPESSNANESQATIRLLISLLKMLVFAGFISSQNAESASEALDELGNFIIVSQRSTLSEHVLFSREDLLNVRETYKGHLKDIKDKSFIRDGDVTPVKITPSELGVRVNRILDVLRAGGDFNIRDISSNMPEYSEKTIQREIAVLVKRGVVRRDGLKRWSRYSIAQNSS